mmetsp:Transcript_7069/g.10568  ORF Transcript_7069/g.10568 Transcript_7069/m.10568 type:complete len:242 (+) Transcript_7069:120-845(+)
MQSTIQHATYEFPSILCGEEVLVPIRIDLCHKGVRYIDTFTWNLFDSLMTPDEFAWKSCADLNIPCTLHRKFAGQIQEQIDAYHMLISILENAENIDLICAHIKSHAAEISIRHNVVDYTDKFQWDPCSSIATPEEYARTTCADVGLPPEMEPSLSYHLRESCIRALLKSMDESGLLSKPSSIGNIVSSISLDMIPSRKAVDMLTNLWKDGKPSSTEAEDGNPHPTLPPDPFSNAAAWSTN